MAGSRESLEMYLTPEQIEQIKSLPEEDRQQATEDMLGIKRFKNGAVDLTTVPGKTGDFFRKKEMLLHPERVKDAEGMTPRRYGRDNYFEATCPYCGTSTEHEGKKYRYSKKTRALLIRDAILIALICLLVMFRLLHVVIGLVAVTLASLDFANHSRRKMYSSVNCRKCGAHFPLDEDILEELKAEIEEERARRQAEILNEEDFDENFEDGKDDEQGAEGSLI